MSNNRTTFCRLPTSVKPSHYELELEPDLENFTFNGSVDIHIVIEKTVGEILLNSLELQINEVSLEHESLGLIQCCNYTCNEHEETCRITFSQELPIGKAKLRIRFVGILNDKMKGFYRSKCISNGVVNYNAVTHFEATGARKSFPCWDEPLLKATFSVVLIVNKDLVALSNMNVESETEVSINGEVKKRFSYKKTPVMSTYLLAYAVGKFDFIEKYSEHGVKVRVYTPPNKSYQGKHALNVATKALDFYDNYFNIPYPLTKLDLIAVADFAIGAMENWGLVTYRESALLVDSEKSSAKQKQWVTIIVCHELAHMWFGNLVTMEWWTHLWLKEGFASFMQYMATHHCHPEYQIWGQYVNETVITALDMDALDNSHPIEVAVGNPEEVDEIFDAISYQKGSSVIRMLYNWIGAELFQAGIQKYLKKFSYQNTQTEDLWKCLEEASGKPVEKVMSTWTLQMGFPIIDVSIKDSTENSVTLSLTQCKYTASSSCSNTEFLWSVPISIETYSNNNSSIKVHEFLFESKKTTFTLEGVKKDDLIKLNPDFCGFYRVNYDKKMLDKLLLAVKENKLNYIDRLNIINDVYSIAKTGKISLARYLVALKVYRNETKYPVWYEIITKLTEIKFLIWNDESSTRMFVDFKNSLLEKIASETSIDAYGYEDHFAPLMRNLIFSNYDSTKINRILIEKFENIESIDSSLVKAVFGKYLSQGGPEEFQKIIKMHKSTDSQEAKSCVESVLGCIKDPEAFKMAQDYMMSQNIRDNTRYFVLYSMASTSKEGRDKMWQMVQENWSVFTEMYRGGRAIGRIVRYSIENFASHEKLMEVENFFEGKVPQIAMRAYKQSVEKIKENISQWKMHQEELISFLQNQNKTSGKN